MLIFNYGKERKKISEKKKIAATIQLLISNKHLIIFFVRIHKFSTLANAVSE